MRTIGTVIDQVREQRAEAYRVAAAAIERAEAAEADVEMLRRSLRTARNQLQEATTDRDVALEGERAAIIELDKMQARRDGARQRGDALQQALIDTFNSRPWWHRWFGGDR